ncbi:hypothetical protein COOONC_24098 [Cooperia oncophora]
MEPIKGPSTPHKVTIMLAKCTLLICLLSFVAPHRLRRSEETACPDGWLRLFNSCYFYERNRMTFDKAESNCAAKGGRLFVPNSAVEWKEVVKNVPEKYWSWVGMKREGSYMPKWKTSGGLNVAELD